MKKLYVILGLLISAFSVFAQPACTPDPTLNTPGIRPKNLPNGQVGIAYSQVVSLLVPLDTSVVYSGTRVNVRVDSSTVIYLSNFPAGFSYVCDKPSKTWNGGQRGCARLFGNPTVNNRGKYVIWVKTHTFFKIVGISGTFDQIDSSSIDFLIDWKTGINEVTTIARLKAFPNPVLNILTIAPEKYSAAGTYKIIDLLGNELNIQPVYSPNTGEIKFDLSSLTSGIYMVKEEVDGKFAQSKFIKE